MWLSNGTAGEGEGNSYGGLYPFMASGEEKTVYEFPHGYGYPVGASDTWILNYMIHNLTSKAAQVYITYDIDFVPATSPAAASITPVHPIWMDVEDHHIYPVFNVYRHSGVDGKFTFPDMAKHPYAKGAPPLNEFTVDHPGTLVATAGHLHPGGLYDDLDLIRPATKPAPGTIPGTVPDSVRLFRSNAHYFDKRGPISWDMAMTATPADWRPQVKAGDVLRISATYNTTRASWYESMGIMVVWEAWNTDNGTDPFAHPIDERGHVTHGHLAEDNNHGGAYSLGRQPQRVPRLLAQHRPDRPVPVRPRRLHLDRHEPLHPHGHRGPLDHLRQRRRQPALPRQPAQPHQGLHGLGLPHGHLMPEPVRAEHRHLLPAGQRHRRL